MRTFDSPAHATGAAMRERIARALNSVLGSEADDHPRHHPAQNSWEEPSEVWWTQWLEAADAVIAALSSPAPEGKAAQGVEVKALEWTGNEEDTSERAVTEIGEYRVEYTCWGGRYQWCAYYSGRNFARTGFRSKDEAKTAAQADFDRRIMACLG